MTNYFSSPFLLLLLQSFIAIVWSHSVFVLHRNMTAGVCMGPHCHCTPDSLFLLLRLCQSVQNQASEPNEEHNFAWGWNAQIVSPFSSVSHLTSFYKYRRSSLETLSRIESWSMKQMKRNCSVSRYCDCKKSEKMGFEQAGGFYCRLLLYFIISFFPNWAVLLSWG